MKTRLRSIGQRIARTRHIGKIAALGAVIAILGAGYAVGGVPGDHSATSASDGSSSIGTNDLQRAPAVAYPTAAPTAGPAALPAIDGEGAFSGSDGSDGSNGSGGSVDTSGVLAAAQQALTVKTGDLSLQVSDLDKAIADAQNKVVAAGGSVSASTRSGSDEYATASITFRIPVAKWEDTLAALRKIGTKVISEQTGATDVTMQVIDYNARIDNLQKTEATLQSIMARASSVPDVMTVETQLSSVEGQIEELTAQRDHLNDQAAMSTLTLELSLPAPTVTTQTTEGWTLADQVDQAGAALVRIGQGLATIGVWAIVVVLPVAFGLLVLFVLFLIARRVTRRGAREGSSPEAAA